MSRSNCCCQPGRPSCLKDRQSRCACAVCFGLGISVSCFCPVGLTLFLCAVIMAALGISLLRH